MIGSFITRGLVMVFGYAYPAYECYKTVDKNKPDIEQLRFWCQYWILVAMLTVFERVGDTFVSWVPMYSEAKLFFFIYLWYPKTKGTTYVYDSFFRPYVAKHETDIDRNLLELRTRAGDYAVLYWQKAASYSQTRIFDILQYIASQSTPKPRSTQPQGTRVRQPAAPQNRKAAAAQPQVEEPPNASGTSSSEAPEDLVEEQEPSEAPAAAPPAAIVNAQKSTITKPHTGSSKPRSSTPGGSTKPIDSTLSETTKPATSTGEAMAIEETSSSAKEDATDPQETVTEETIRVTRGRSRRTRAASGR